jgi:hypothetical protein
MSALQKQLFPEYVTYCFALGATYEDIHFSIWAHIYDCILFLKYITYDLKHQSPKVFKNTI